MSVEHQTSFSNPSEVTFSHLQWRVSVDFDTKILKGEATYTIVRRKKECSSLFLDTTALKIDSISDQNGKELDFQIGFVKKKAPHLGSPLAIQLGNLTTAVTIRYETTDQCSAIQWLKPSQTVGKKHPYLYTQCFAIHARSLLPCQDLPGVKMTYHATVAVPSWATCVMSALLQGEPRKSVHENDGTRIFVWEQKVPIPSYLIAMAIGELDKRDISPRSAIWCEPALLEIAAKEFSQVDDFITTAEEIAGLPYTEVWGRYDLLCLPPSLPFGGVENPCLTFLTPTLLTGDRSLVDVVAHEIAHSWTGNLVTNATWDHFWLNEGWTMWLQRKIMSRIHKSDQYFDFDALCGLKSLQDAVNDMPPEFTKLVLDIQDRDPDTSYSVVPYEKGFHLLMALERRVGKEAFEAFFPVYIKNFRNKNLTSEEFKDFVMKYFSNMTNISGKENEGSSLLDFNWNAWLYEPGMPPEVISFDKTMAEGPDKLAKIWLAVDRNGRMLPSIDIQSWTSGQKTYFLDALREATTADQQPLQLATLNALHKQYGFAESSNAEILFRYCMLAIASEGPGILPVAFHMVTSQGRLKYVRPLYRALLQSKMAADVTVEIFLQNKEFYHPICAKLITSDLHLDRWWNQRYTKIAAVSLGLATFLTGGYACGTARNAKSRGEAMPASVKMSSVACVATVVVAGVLCGVACQSMGKK